MGVLINGVTIMTYFMTQCEENTYFYVVIDIYKCLHTVPVGVLD